MLHPTSFPGLMLCCSDNAGTEVLQLGLFLHTKICSLYQARSIPQGQLSILQGMFGISPYWPCQESLCISLPTTAQLNIFYGMAFSYAIEG